MKKLALALALIAVPVHAQDASDQYWQQIVGNKEAISSKQIVDLQRALDAANKLNNELRKQLADKAKEQPKAPTAK